MENKHSEIILAIYDTILNPDDWPHVFERVLESIGSCSGILRLVDTIDEDFYVNLVTPPFTIADMEYYAEHLLRFDQKAWEFLTLRPSQTLYTDEDVWPDRDEFDANPTVIWGKKFGVYHRVACKLFDKGPLADTLVFHYEVGRGQITDEERAVANILIPHIAKALEVSRIFMMLRAKCGAMLDALDLLQMGVLIISPDQHVELSNRMAGVILDREDGLSLDSQRRLVAASAKDRVKLNQAITSTLGLLTQRHLPQLSRLRVLRPSKARPYLIEVKPFLDTGEIVGNFFGAIVLIIDPELRDLPFEDDRITKVFGLTRSESEISTLLAQGCSLHGIAQRRRTTMSTVRSQLKTIFSKTGVNRQSDLIRLLYSLNLPIENVQ